MNAPRLRFNEFNSDWKKIRLNEITTRIGDGLHSTPEYDEEGSIYFANGSNIKDGVLVFDENTKTINVEEFTKYKFLLNKNSVLVSLNGATWGRFGLYHGEKILLGKSLGYINISESHSKYFMYYQLQLKKIRRFFESEITGSTIKNLSLQTLRNTEVNIPTLDEQDKIASFLIILEQKIQLQKEKIDLLKKQKKGILQNVFSQSNIANWQKLKLKSFSNFISGKSKNNSIEETGKFLIMDMGSVSVEGEIIASKRTNSSKDLLELGDLVMPKDDIGGGKIIGLTAHISQNNTFVLGDHVYLIKINPEICFSLFAHYQFHSNLFRKRLKRLVTGSAQLGVTSSNILEEYFYLPPLEKQIKLANLLNLIDKKIELEIHKLNNIQIQKQSFMQQMFI